MATGDLADVLAGTIAATAGYPGICLERLVLQPPSPGAGSFTPPLRRRARPSPRARAAGNRRR